MEPVMEQLDIHSNFDAFEDYMERFEIWTITKEDVEDVNIVVHFLTFIGKEAHNLLKTFAFPEKPISLPYATLKGLLLDYDIKNSTTLLCHPNQMRAQGYADNNSLKSCDAGHEDEHKFGKCLSCGKFHSCNSCVFRNAKYFKYSNVGHIQTVCHSDPINLNVPNESHSNRMHDIILSDMHLLLALLNIIFLVQHRILSAKYFNKFLFLIS
ncbi:unnamed protein product [Schistosoma curassoni]|uniref:Retrovirus-related Pol polyprotein from transposon TNT 1-94 n=1 Tax=Schistosoma curassoni TaxID=6186 RepID=A0A183JS50_9TREM|nr:unnamed protein product [Schistosoma curassoni]